MPKAPPIAPPPLDSRAASDFASQTQALAVQYTKNLANGAAGWQPAPGGSDSGSALVQIFATMRSQLSTRLNQVLENNHLAFLSLLGGKLLPYEAARAPLTFSLVPVVANTTAGTARVPAGTTVAAPAA